MKLTRKQLRKMIIESINESEFYGRAQPAMRSTMKPFSLGNLNEGQTLVIDYRSPPSGLGTLDPSGIIIQFDGSSPAVDDGVKTSHYNSEMEEREDYRELAAWLANNHNVTHVRDSEMQFDGRFTPASDGRYKLKDWISNVMELF